MNAAAEPRGTMGKSSFAATDIPGQNPREEKKPVVPDSLVAVGNPSSFDKRVNCVMPSPELRGSRPRFQNAWPTPRSVDRPISWRVEAADETALVAHSGHRFTV